MNSECTATHYNNLLYLQTVFEKSMNVNLKIMIDVVPTVM